MPASQYGHSTRGINLQNLRDVGGTTANLLPGGFRAPLDWQREVRVLPLQFFHSSDSAKAYVQRYPACVVFLALQFNLPGSAC